MIFISHDLNAISRVADRIVVLNHGAVVDRGDFQHILHHAQDPYTKLLVEKRADVMRRYTAVLNGKKETAHTTKHRQMDTGFRKSVLGRKY